MRVLNNCSIIILCFLICMATAGKESEALKMKREMGFIGGIAIVSGTMIIWGISMSPQFVLVYVRSPGASLEFWAFSGFIAMCGPSFLNLVDISCTY